MKTYLVKHFNPHVSADVTYMGRFVNVMLSVKADSIDEALRIAIEALVQSLEAASKKSSASLDMILLKSFGIDVKKTNYDVNAEVSYYSNAPHGQKHVAPAWITETLLLLEMDDITLVSISEPYYAGFS